MESEAFYAPSPLNARRRGSSATTGYMRPAGRCRQGCCALPGSRNKQAPGCRGLAAKLYQLRRKLRRLVRDLGTELREGLFFTLPGDQDRWLDQDQQDLVILGHRGVGEQTLEERHLAESRDALFAFEFGGEGLATEHQRAAVRN